MVSKNNSNRARAARRQKTSNGSSTVTESMIKVEGNILEEDSVRNLPAKVSKSEFSPGTAAHHERIKFDQDAEISGPVIRLEASRPDVKIKIECTPFTSSTASPKSEPGHSDTIFKKERASSTASAADLKIEASRSEMEVKIEHASSPASAGGPDDVDSKGILQDLMSQSIKDEPQQVVTSPEFDFSPAVKTTNQIAHGYEYYCDNCEFFPMFGSNTCLWSAFEDDKLFQFAKTSTPASSLWNSIGDKFEPRRSAEQCQARYEQLKPGPEIKVAAPVLKQNSVGKAGKRSGGIFLYN